MTQKNRSISHPSDTTDGRNFLNQFRHEEYETAKLLIDSVEIHSHHQVLNSMRDALINGAYGTSQNPAVLIPIRSQEDLPSLEGKNRHTAYESFDPGASIAVTPGSEGDMGSVISGILSSEPKSFLGPSITLNEMILRKVRTIVLITDYCGSGNQALRFVRSFIDNSTIASWVSSGHIRLEVLAYSSSATAIEKFAKDKIANFTHLVAAKSGPATGWSPDETMAVTQLCRDYAGESDIEYALGYDDSFGLYSTNFRVPNNLPALLIRDDKKLKGLFPKRTVSPLFSTELPSFLPRSSVSQIVKNLGDVELADFIDQMNRPRRASMALAVLSLLTRGYSQRQIQTILALKDADWNLLKASLYALNFIEWEFEVTASGKQELARSRIRGKTSRENAPSTTNAEVEYLPTKLR